MFRFIDGNMVLEELAAGWTVEQLKGITTAWISVSLVLQAYSIA
ncbi:MAG: hypothetical protein M0Z65_11930 [Firmicutes bacterium]|nr:hypothetical protein [Melghirimyces thermohalophilus]MDA8353860.1 hypothetical protein [Bacillota bacterium]